jgi:hypothetical protein
MGKVCFAEETFNLNIFCDQVYFCKSTNFHRIGAPREAEDAHAKIQGLALRGSRQRQDMTFSHFRT